MLGVWINGDQSFPMSRKPGWNSRLPNTKCPLCGNPLTILTHAENNSVRFRMNCYLCGFTDITDPKPISRFQKHLVFDSGVWKIRQMRRD